MTSEINYDIECDERNGYLLVRITDTFIRLPDAVDYTNKVMRRVREKGYKGVIIVDEVPLRMDPDQLKLFGNVIANMLPADTRMAVVDATPSHDASLVFAEVARGRHKDVRIFRNLQDAEQWISDPNPCEAEPFATQRI